jgi:hypothetical protein
MDTRRDTDPKHLLQLQLSHLMAIPIGAGPFRGDNHLERLNTIDNDDQTNKLPERGREAGAVSRISWEQEVI